MSFKTLMKLMMMGYGMSDSLQKSLIPVPIEIKARPCLYCRKSHKGKNCYCSAECCNLAKKISRDKRKLEKIVKEQERIQKHINSPCFDGVSHVRSRV